MSWKHPIRYFFIITLCLITEAFAEKVDPLLLHDLGKLKGISDRYHEQEKPTLSKELKNDHNQLAAEVNGFIESIVMFADTNISQKDKEKIESVRRSINTKANSLDDELKDYKDSTLQTKRVYASALPLAGRVIGEWIAVKSLDELWSHLFGSDQKDKLVQELNEKRWILIS